MESLAFGAMQSIKCRSPAPRGSGWSINSKPNTSLVSMYKISYNVYNVSVYLKYTQIEHLIVKGVACLVEISRIHKISPFGICPECKSFTGYLHGFFSQAFSKIYFSVYHRPIGLAYQPLILFSQNKPITNYQPTIFFFQPVVLFSATSQTNRHHIECKHTN
jgi:hypothetical protein